MVTNIEPVERIMQQVKQLTTKQQQQLMQRMQELSAQISTTTSHEPSHEQRIQQFEAEMANFERLKPQLLQQYPNKFVAIYQGEVVAIGDEKMDLLATVQEKFGNVPCYITKVTEEGPRRVRMLSPRVIR